MSLFMFKKFFYFYFLFFCLLSSCVQKFSYDTTLSNSIPDKWSSQFPNDSLYIGDWWLAFNDSLFLKYFNNFQNNSVDLKSLVLQADLARQVAIIGGASIYPSVGLSSSTGVRKQNLSSFGFTSNMLDLDNSEDYGEKVT